MVTWDRCIRLARSRKASTSIRPSSTFWPRRSRLVEASWVETDRVTVRPSCFFCWVLVSSRRLDSATRVLMTPACTSTWPSLGASSTVASLSMSKMSTGSPTRSSRGSTYPSLERLRTGSEAFSRSRIPARSRAFCSAERALFFCRRSSSSSFNRASACWRVFCTMRAASCRARSISFWAWRSASSSFSSDCFALSRAFRAPPGPAPADPPGPGGSPPGGPPPARKRCSPAHQLPGPVHDAPVQSQPPGDGEGVGLPRHPDEQPVGGPQGGHVELAAGVLHPVGLQGVGLQLGVVGGAGQPGPLTPQLLDEGRGQGRALHRVGTGAQLVQQHQASGCPPPAKCG